MPIKTKKGIKKEKPTDCKHLFDLWQEHDSEFYWTTGGYTVQKRRCKICNFVEYNRQEY